MNQPTQCYKQSVHVFYIICDSLMCLGIPGTEYDITTHDPSHHNYTMQKQL